MSGHGRETAAWLGGQRRGLPAVTRDAPTLPCRSRATRQGGAFSRSGPIRFRPAHLKRLALVLTRSQSSTVPRSAAAWACGFALVWALGKVLDIGIGQLWQALQRALGTMMATGAAILLVALLSTGLAVLRGKLMIPGRMLQLRAMCGARRVPFSLRDLGGLRGVASGRRSRRWPTLTAFQDEDPRRVGSPSQPQADYGYWRDPGAEVAQRLTYIFSTGEVVATGGAPTDPVELLTVVASNLEVETRLAGWDYAGFGGRDLQWVRQRLHGWRVPLPARGRWWMENDARPPQPWPAPPTPSVGAQEGAYHGHDRHTVLRVDARGQEPLYHAVEHSPTGLSWGYSGSGPTDLARSLLFDRLGYVPQPRIVFALRDEIVARLPESFVLTYAHVDAWISGHRDWFREDPRADPLDLLAAGGA
jgi:hypothetical protein